MRVAIYCSLFVVCWGCTEATSEPAWNEPERTPSETAVRAGDPGRVGAVELAEPEAEPLGPPIGAAPAPVELAQNVAMLMGVTGDGWAVYRNAEGVVAVAADGSTKEPALVSSTLGLVQIRGPVVFLFSDVDWTTNVGTLTIWTAAHGTRFVGSAIYGDDAVFGTADGAWIGWMGNPSSDPQAEPTADVMVATPDLQTVTAVLPQIGTGSEGTCRPRLGFVGERLFAAACAPHSTAALLAALDAPEFVPIPIASGAGTAWSTDQSGTTVFWTDALGGAWLREIGGAAKKLDQGVGWGTPLADASAVLYTVGDQLRRAQAPGFTPMPIITNGFLSRAALSPDLSHALYSTQVTYVDGTERDLLLTATTKLNHLPMRLVDQPLAELSRDAFTSNGKWVLYTIESELHMRSVTTLEGRAISNVDTVLAAHGSRVVYSTNRSGPETWPITADLAVADPAAQGEPVMLMSGTTDGRSFYLSADRSRVFYAVPAQGEKPSALYAQGIP